MKNLLWTSLALTVALILSFGLMSCDESPMTADPGTDGATIAKKPGGGGGPGGGNGGGDDTPFTNWAFAVTDGNILLLSADGSTSSKLTKGGKDYKLLPAFTHDGQDVAYLYYDDGSSLELRMVGVDDANDRLVYIFGQDGPAFSGQSLQWLPGSDKLLYLGDSDLHLVYAATQSAQSLGVNSLFPGELINIGEASPGPDLSPDAGFQGRIAVSVWRANEDDADIYVVMASEDGDGLITLDPGSLVRLSLPDTPDGRQNFPTFSPDGSAIAFVDVAACCSGKQLKVVSFDAVSSTFGVPLLLDEPELFVQRAPVWAPDGSWIGYTATSRGRGGAVSNLYVVRPDGSSKTTVGAADAGLDWNPTWCNDIDSPGSCGP